MTFILEKMMIPVLFISTMMYIIAFVYEIYRLYTEEKKRKLLVEQFIKLNEDWWTTPENGMYGWKYQAEKYLEYWVQHNKFGPSYGVVNFSIIENKFMEFIGNV